MRKKDGVILCSGRLILLLVMLTIIGIVTMGCQQGSRILTDKMMDGTNDLTIENREDLDVVAVLTLANEPQEVLVAMYIPSGNSNTVTYVKAGEYLLHLTFGKNWDNDSKKFMEKVFRFRRKGKLHLRGFYDYNIILGKTGGRPKFAERVEVEKLEEPEYPAEDWEVTIWEWFSYLERPGQEKDD